MQSRLDTKSQVFSTLTTELLATDKVQPMNPREFVKKRLEAPIRSDLVKEAKAFVKPF
jgi:hypothetical protein